MDNRFSVAVGNIEKDFQMGRYSWQEAPNGEGNIKVWKSAKIVNSPPCFDSCNTVDVNQLPKSFER